jgi:hypothetical protein
MHDQARHGVYAVWRAGHADQNYGALAAGAGTRFGIPGQWLGANGAPALSCVATR